MVATTTPEELDSTPTDLLTRTKENVERFLYLLEEAAEERGISCAPLTEIEHRWDLLWRKYPDPKDAIKHFRDFFPLPLLTKRINSAEPIAPRMISASAVSNGQHAPKLNPFAAAR